MNYEDVKIYKPELGIDGTIGELLDWAYRYDSDYSDEALDEISAQAKAFGAPEKKVLIPILVKEGRQRESRKDHTLPYESMKLDRLEGGNIGYSSTEEYGEVEIREEEDKVLISITGSDEEGSFSAANAYPADEFMNGDTNWLESAVGSTLFYGKVYEEQ